MAAVVQIVRIPVSERPKQTVASGQFHFRDLGKMHTKGFEKPGRVYALIDDEAS